MDADIQAARGVTIRRVTSGPASHFFGYYDMPSWDASGRYLLTQRVNLDVEIPSADDHATIGTVDLENACRFREISTTRTWSWQQGAMLHWLPEHGPTTVVYNDSDGDRYVTRVVDIESGTSRVLDRPIAAVSHDQRRALSLNFARLRVRPEVGYPGLPDPWEDVDHPADDGIYLVDLDSGTAELAVSLDEIVSVRPHPSMHGAINWVNHLIFSPDDAHAMFVHRWWPPGAPRFRTRFMLLRIADASVREIWPTRASHMCWRSPSEIQFSAIPADVPDDPESRSGQMGFWLLDLATGDARPVGRNVLPPDGHCSYRPGGRFVLMDTQPDSSGLRRLLVYDEDTERALELGRFHSPPRYAGPVRCDLHPRWSRDGRQVCIDSVHEGSRQMYVIDAAEALNAWIQEA
ncbi:MAG: hypothetical protein OXG65_08575 [Chloroflexi bacterium]|nr:hypothetical protein [Chloroflexota bacterium]